MAAKGPGVCHAVARMASPGLRPDEVEIAAVESQLYCALVLAAYVAAGWVGSCGSDAVGPLALGASKIEAQLSDLPFLDADAPSIESPLARDRPGSPGVSHLRRA